MRSTTLALLLSLGAALAAAPSGRALAGDGPGVGAKVFSQNCAGCHGSNAEGVPGSYPRLRDRVGKIARTEAGRRYLASAVNFGLFGTITVDGQSISGVMPPHPQLSPDQLAAVLNYLASLGGGKGRSGEKPFSASLVRQIRGKHLSATDVHGMREEAIKGAGDASGGDGSASAAKPGTDGKRLVALRKAVSTYRVKARNTFQLNCAGCHGFHGESPTGDVPTLKGFVGYFPHLDRGRAFLGRVSGVSMSMLDDLQTAQVLNWLLLTFSSQQLPADFRPYTASEVHDLREHPLTTESDSTRAEIVAALRQRGVIDQAHGR